MIRAQRLLPGYFTGNPEYYRHIEKIRLIPRMPKQQNKHLIAKWMSADEMAIHLNIKLVPKAYQTFIKKLSQIVHDPYAKIFVKPGSTIEESKKHVRTLDEHGRAYALGSRKSARAQVWMVKGSGLVYVNGHKLNTYFLEHAARRDAVESMVLTDRTAQYNVWALVEGGGRTGQSQAIGVAVARTLAIMEPDLLGVSLHKAGYTKIDRRQQERKKTGQPGARKKNRWVKR